MKNSTKMAISDNKLSIGLVSVSMIFLALVVVVIMVIGTPKSMDFRVSGNSMNPTFKDGEHISISGTRHPSKDEIVVFNEPVSWTMNLKPVKAIKRIVATEGDTYELHNRDVRINGETIYKIPSSVKCQVSDYSHKVSKNEIAVAGDNHAVSADTSTAICYGLESPFVDKPRIVIHGNPEVKGTS